MTKFSASPYSIDQFDVEESKNCYFDSLRVFDGETNDTLLFGPLCGQLNETQSNRYIDFMAIKGT